MQCFPCAYTYSYFIYFVREELISKSGHYSSLSLRLQQNLMTS